MRFRLLIRLCAFPLCLMVLQFFWYPVSSLDTRLIKSAGIFVDSLTDDSHQKGSSKGENLLKPIRLTNVEVIPRLMRQVADSYDIPRLFINFFDDSRSILMEKLGFVKCCDHVRCSISRGCPQIPLLTLLGLGLPTFSKCPDEIRPQFLIFSKENPSHPTIVGHDVTDVQIASFPIAFNTKIYVLIHGFTDKFHKSGWMRILKDNILEGSQSNPVVIVLDWSRAAQTVFVSKAAASTKMTGVLLGSFLWKLQLLQGADLSKMHLIGHSFGAEISATAGKFLKRLSNGQRLGTITGLDPAGVCTTYDGQKKKRCLKFEDANLVRILHSDSLYFGTEEAIGHYDIFLNGGHFQPQCFPHASALLNPEAFLIGLSCSHFRVVRLFLTLYFQYSNCQPIGYECSSYDLFLRGRCASCDNNRCTYVGYEEQIGYSGHILDNPDARNKRVFMKTDSELPFCLHHYQIYLHTIASVHGSILITGHAQEPVQIRLDRESTGLLTLSGKHNAHRFSQLILTSHSPMDSLSVIRIDVNYMSNIDPEQRRAYSSRLCPAHTGPAGIVFQPCIL